MGPKTEPCATLEDTVIISEFEPFSKTNWVLLSNLECPPYAVKVEFSSNFHEQLCQNKKEGKDQE